MICDFNDPQCEKKAVKVLRLITIPKNECQVFMLYKKMVVCKEHAEEMCHGTEFEYENLPTMNPDDVMNEQLFQKRNHKT